MPNALTIPNVNVRSNKKTRWAELNPVDDTMPPTLSLGELDAIVDLVQDEPNFDKKTFRDTFLNPTFNLFEDGDFLRLRLTHTSARFIKVKDGLLRLVARAIGLESYEEIIRPDNLEKWQQLHESSKTGGNRAT